MVNVHLFPQLPGVYLFKDKDGKVIYIGKAKFLKKRVSSYFQKRHDDWKVQSLLSEHASVDYIVVKSEMEALLLEAQMICDYKPKFNVLLKSGQPFVYILFTQGKLPQIKLVRNQKLKGKYFGPFLQKVQARKVFEYLVNTFHLHLCNKKIENGCLDYHLGLCAGNCKTDFDTQGYLFRLQLAKDALKHKHATLLKSLKEKIAEYNKNLEFEKSKHLQEYIDNLDLILQTIRIKFKEEKFENEIFAAVTPIKQIYNFAGDVDQKLQQFLKLDKPIRSIDCFDISHFQSSYLTGSCIRFVDGKPEKNKFRRFKIKTLKKQNDCAALQEVVLRRYKKKDDFPDLIMIDGGKGQLNAILKLIGGVACISLAKREETVFGKAYPKGVKLDLKTDIGRLLTALRDYAHHFAISYHRKRRTKESF